MEVRLPPVSPQPHTHLVWEGFQYAREHGKGHEYNHRVLEEFFVEGQDIGDTDVLARLASEVGLDEQELRQALRERKCRDAHQAALRHAREEARVTAGPAFLIGQSMLTGLQSKETLERVIDAEKRNPQAASVSGAASGTEGRPA